MDKLVDIILTHSNNIGEITGRTIKKIFTKQLVIIVGVIVIVIFGTITFIDSMIKGMAKKERHKNY